jgi:hypothetical protein
MFLVNLHLDLLLWGLAGLAIGLPIGYLKGRFRQ